MILCVCDLCGCVCVCVCGWVRAYVHVSECGCMHACVHACVCAELWSLCFKLKGYPENVHVLLS